MTFVPDLIHLPRDPTSCVRGVTRDGSLVRSGPEAEWPDRCVVCNAPAHGSRLKVHLTWYPPQIYFLLPALPLFFLAAAFLNQSATIHVGLCDAHSRRRRQPFYLVPIAAGLTMGACAGGLGLVPKDKDVLAVGVILCSLVLMVAIFVWGVMRSHALEVRSIKDGTVWATCGQSFLESLPSETAVGG